MTSIASLAAAAVAQGFQLEAEQRLVHPHPRARIVLLLQLGEMTFAAEFLRPFVFQISVRELRDADYLDFWTTPELTFDDPEFDEAALVRGSPFGVRQLLGPDVRRCLLDLRLVARGFTLDATHLRAVCAVTEANAGVAADRFVSAVHALTGSSESGSAYR
jgi:hypothetical protein